MLHSIWEAKIMSWLVRLHSKRKKSQLNTLLFCFLFKACACNKEPNNLLIKFTIAVTYTGDAEAVSPPLFEMVGIVPSLFRGVIWFKKKKSANK